MGNADYWPHALQKHIVSYSHDYFNCWRLHQDRDWIQSSHLKPFDRVATYIQNTVLALKQIQIEMSNFIQPKCLDGNNDYNIIFILF